MREIKKRDNIVYINPLRQDSAYQNRIGSVDPFYADNLYLWSDYCLAPNPEHKYKEGDWVLPVVMCGGERRHDELLKPFKIYSLNWDGSGLICGGDECNCLWGKSEIVLITREGDYYIINDSCKLTAAEFKNRYRCDPIPANRKPEPARPQYADYTGTARVKWQPTYEDYRDCCGSWIDDDAEWGDTSEYVTRSIRITEYCLPRDYESRSDFDETVTNAGFTRIEPVPEQRIPVPKPDRGSRTTTAVERYPRVTEWD